VSELVVGVDVSPLIQTRAGTHRYLTNLLPALERSGAVKLKTYSFGGEGRASTILRDTVWYQVGLPKAVKEDGIDVLHCPTQRAPVRPGVPMIVTIHDLAVLRMPAAFNPWTRTLSHFMVPKAVAAASHIVAVSSFTASELTSLLDVSPARISVVPHGVAAPFSSDGPAAEGNFVLAVSTREPRKNLVRLAAAFAEAQLDDCELWVAGSPGWGDVRVEGPRVRMLGHVSDDQLARLYRGSRCVAYVPLYEGFGLPVLEAMACGAAVVASDLPPLRELAEGVAIFVDPYDIGAIAAALRQAVECRRDLGLGGPERARPYTWERAATSSVELYRRLSA
jgi:glycosyltransferase involved in cell wall biosynthesis